MRSAHIATGNVVQRIGRQAHRSRSTDHLQPLSFQLLLLRPIHLWRPGRSLEDSPVHPLPIELLTLIT